MRRDTDNRRVPNEHPDRAQGNIFCIGIEPDQLVVDSTTAHCLSLRASAINAPNLRHLVWFLNRGCG